MSSVIPNCTNINKYGICTLLKLGLTSCLQGSVNVHRGALLLVHKDSASVLLYFIFLSHLLPLPCGAGSTVPREGSDSSVIKPFSWCVVAVTLPI